MATFGVSLPNDLHQELDAVAKGWRSNRSQAIVRIFQEWKQTQRMAQQFPRFIPNSDPIVTGPVVSEEEAVYLGTGPGDEF